MMASTLLRRFSASLLPLGLAVAAWLPSACSSGTAADEKVCTPNKDVFCRCQNRQEGTKHCNEDGTAYGPCDPCESWDNPEWSDDDSLDERPRTTRRDGGVDGSSPSATCGNGIAEFGEDCDDDNGGEADGCSTACKLAGTNPPATVSCPGLAVHVWGGDHKPTLIGSTVGSGNHGAQAACDSTYGAAASDRVFRVVAHKNGQLKVVTTETTFNGFLYAAAACENTVNWVTCANKDTQTSGETLTTPVQAGQELYVFVDGAGSAGAGELPNEGTFRVTFSIE